ncbi:GntR family transcriptional regulator [Rhodococcoides kyotonense]|uniref:DNA-binding transcriptional regulator, GntR family n=1 Tax=Rhodococcoides kyotonense TaxID=398843 RepID=A0A239N8E1_9NOCA|nr:GntR family transcriptional regulator [Rhodococcus kyotonensis]SNT50752.1 DNA-binding transcriptional regulator, GntR family [Rhodococcus kyotonensis]
MTDLTDDTSLRRFSLRDQALSVIRKQVVTGDIVPGEIYSAAAIASSLGVSNSPVREAMLTLVNQGVMEAVRNRGFRLIPLSEKDRSDIYDLRIMLEVPAMGRLAANRTKIDPKFSELATDTVVCAVNGDMVQYLDSDRQFHLGLLALLGNSRLVEIVGDLRDRTRLVNVQALSKEGSLEKSAREHHTLLDALIAGDGARAEEVMRKHLHHIPGDWNAAGE